MLLVLGLDELVLGSLVLVVGSGHSVLDLSQGSLLPVFEIILVEVEEEGEVLSSKLLDLIFVDGHEHGGEHTGAMGVHEQSLADLTLIDHISQIFHEE